jgi:hypothetical protein
MKFLCILLIPALIAGPPDQPPLSNAVKKLLRKPRVGAAELTWRDGTKDRVGILRVTESFISLQRANRPCENVELTRIARIKWNGYEGTGDFDDFGLLVFALVFPPSLLVSLPLRAAKRAIGSHDAKLGSWETMLGNQEVERVRFAYSGHEPGEGVIFEQKAYIQRGHYRLAEGILYTRDDADPYETAVPMHLDCANLQVGSLSLQAQSQRARASSPIVGRWSNRETVWEFREDGAFQTERIESQMSGFYTKSKYGIKVAWNSPVAAREEWKGRQTNQSLFITRNSTTTEFKRREPFY